MLGLDSFISDLDKEASKIEKNRQDFENLLDSCKPHQKEVLKKFLSRNYFAKRGSNPSSLEKYAIDLDKLTQEAKGCLGKLGLYIDKNLEILVHKYIYSNSFSILSVFYKITDGVSSFVSNLIKDS